MTMQFPVADQTRVNEPLLAAAPIGSRPATTTRCSPTVAIPWHPELTAVALVRRSARRPTARRSSSPTPTTMRPGNGDALWAWKSFLRGHHPILMDFGLIGGVNPRDAAGGDVPPFESFEPARWAMGDTRRYAERMGLIDMAPRGDLTSTGYALANPGAEYLVLGSERGRPAIHRRAASRALLGRVVRGRPDARPRLRGR